MQLEYAIATLQLAHPFRVAHGVSHTRQSVLVKIGDARGEGAIVPYYPWTAEECADWLASLEPDQLDADLRPDGPAPAQTALEIALLDWQAREHGRTLRSELAITAESNGVLTCTLPIPESEEELRARLKDETFDGFPMLKLKVGSGNLDFDEAIIRLVHEQTALPLALDANCAWTPAQTVEILNRCANCRIDLFEQPVSQDTLDGWRELRAILPKNAPPIFADESVQSPDDILALNGLADGINVKLLKTRGLRGALEWISLARSLNMQVMIGTMVESTVGCTAAAQLAPLGDFLDIDIFQEITNDPHVGIELDDGEIQYPEGSGLGLTQHQSVPWK